MISDLEVVTPYRLDLTVSALRRLRTNLVDVYTADGRYLRAFRGSTRPVIVSVTQPRPDGLLVSVTGRAADAKPALAIVRRMLGVDRDVSEFHRRAGRILWLSPLARRLRGIKPPRCPTLFEAAVNAVTFQQVSLHAASAIMRRVIRLLGTPVEHDGVPLAVFPTVEGFLGATDAAIRATGMSTAKLATLRRVGEAIVAGTLSEPMLDELPSPEAALVLRGIKGIGPWTAAVILLRGFGRLDVFPENDSGVAASLKAVLSEQIDATGVVDALRPQCGMLYFCLLLARLEARGEIGLASVAP
ncbi:MAG: DNA-3-methyladenine glycosylase family protein [Gemmatimonadaceae bacterium]